METGPSTPWCNHKWINSHGRVTAIQTRTTRIGSTKIITTTWVEAITSETQISSSLKPRMWRSNGRQTIKAHLKEETSKCRWVACLLCPAADINNFSKEDHKVSNNQRCQCQVVHKASLCLDLKTRDLLLRRRLIWQLQLRWQWAVLCLSCLQLWIRDLLIFHLQPPHQLLSLTTHFSQANHSPWIALLIWLLSQL